jgi:hypothetical protein
MTWGKWYWVVWQLAMVVSLGIPEIYALATNTDNTYSNWIWSELQVTQDQQLPWTAAHYLVFGAWLTVVSWLTWHFFFRRFT